MCCRSIKTVVNLKIHLSWEFKIKNVTFWRRHPRKFHADADDQESSYRQEVTVCCHFLGIKLKIIKFSEAPQDILLDKKPTSLYLSRRFAKRLLVIGISEVCRKLLSFPEEYFILRLAGDMKVKVLNPFGDDGINRNVSMMKKWIRKILELTENGWLEKVLITLSAAVRKTYWWFYCKLSYRRSHLKTR